LALIRLLFLTHFFLFSLTGSGVEAADWKNLMEDLNVRDRQGTVRPFVFYRFLETYMEEANSSRQLRIMGNYYEKHSEKPYRLPSLMFLFNAYRSWNPLHEKFIFHFLKQHHREPLILDLFLYRYGSIEHQPPFAFHKLYEKLKHEIPGFSFPSLEALHFMDLMITQEANDANFDAFCKTLAGIWRNELVSQSKLNDQFGGWIRKIVGLYNRRPQNFLPSGVKAFKSSRERLFARHGYSARSIITTLEKQFILEDGVRSLPPFLPQEP